MLLTLIVHWFYLFSIFLLVNLYFPLYSLLFSSFVVNIFIVNSNSVFFPFFFQFHLSIFPISDPFLWIFCLSFSQFLLLFPASIFSFLYYNVLFHIISNLLSILLLHNSSIWAFPTCLFSFTIILVSIVLTISCSSLLFSNFLFAVLLVTVSSRLLIVIL